MLTNELMQPIRAAQARRDWALVTYAQSRHSLTDDPYAAERALVAAQQDLADAYETLIQQLEAPLPVCR